MKENIKGTSSTIVDERIQEAKKRLNALILLVAFTAILLIVSTYAWFSTQKNVTLSGLHGKVNVAEGLQISLDALNWANEIDLSNNAEAYFAATNENLGYTTEEDKLSLITPWKANEAGDNQYEGRTNLIPDELLPVSTTADTNEGIDLNDLNMYRGENTNGIKLTDIKKVASEAASGYYAIDFFLQNSSSEQAITTNTKDLLRLETNSDIILDASSKESTGLQNTLRVAFAIYDEDTALGENTLVSNTPSQGEILQATTGSARKITDVAIWEPNAKGEQEGTSPAITTYAAHVDYIVQNNNKVTFSGTDRNEWSIPSTNRFTAGMAIPTYALTTNSVAKTISDIYNWDTTASTNGLVKQKTVQTGNTGVGDAPVQLKSVTNGTTDFAIAPGKYIHMRMYVWLEGQDVDCTNYASLGGGITIDVGLSKPGSEDLPEEEKEVISTDTEYVGYYADVDGNGSVDGVIYADLAQGKSGQWGTDSSYGTYSYATETGLKDYYISKKSYVGDFGTKDVITALEGSVGKERFYVMSLENFDDGNGPTYTWYDAANDEGMDDYATATSTDFGAGKTNTANMIAKWNASDYGPQDDNDTYKDMWGVIQEEVEKGWFVPSMSEWVAFGSNLNITKDDYADYNLSYSYWSSSQNAASNAWFANFYSGSMYYDGVGGTKYVRLSATF